MNEQSPRVTEITVCDTCKRPDDAPRLDGATPGAALLAALESAREGLPPEDQSRIAIRSFSCLMNCQRGCSVAIAASNGAPKVSYVLGDFAPEAEAAEALVGYALGHARSETGVVPYKTWPEGVKGHFVARVPAPAVSED